MKKSRFTETQIVAILAEADAGLNKMIFLGEKSLRRALAEFEAHYHTERNHQGIGNNIIDFKEEAGLSTVSIQCRERLGGMLSY